MKDIFVLEVGAVIVVEHFPGTPGQDPNLVQRFGSPSGMGLIESKLLRAGRVQPLELACHPGSGFIVMGDRFLLSEVLFHRLIDRTDLLGSRQAGSTMAPSLTSGSYRSPKISAVRSSETK